MYRAQCIATHKLLAADVAFLFRIFEVSQNRSFKATGRVVRRILARLSISHARPKAIQA